MAESQSRPEIKRVTLEVTNLQVLEFRSATAIAIRQLERLEPFQPLLWGTLVSLRRLAYQLELLQQLTAEAEEEKEPV